LIHHKNQPTQKQVIALAKAKGAGKVKNIISATSSISSSDNAEFTECLQESNNITDILAPLEDPGENQQRTVLVESAPGLGKTVLLKQIAYEWAQKSSW